MGSQEIFQAIQSSKARHASRALLGEIQMQRPSVDWLIM